MKTNTPHSLAGLSRSTLMDIVGSLTVGAQICIPPFNSSPAVSHETQAVVIAKSHDNLTALLDNGQTVSYYNGDCVTRIGFVRSVPLTRSVETLFWQTVGERMRRPKVGKVYLFLKGCCGRFPDVSRMDQDGNILPGSVNVLANTKLEYVGPVGVVNGSLTRMMMFHTYRTENTLLRIRAGHPSEGAQAMILVSE